MLQYVTVSLIGYTLTKVIASHHLPHANNVTLSKSHLYRPQGQRHLLNLSLFFSVYRCEL